VVNDVGGDTDIGKNLGVVLEGKERVVRRDRGDDGAGLLFIAELPEGFGEEHLLEGVAGLEFDTAAAAGGGVGVAILADIGAGKKLQPVGKRGMIGGFGDEFVENGGGFLDLGVIAGGGESEGEVAPGDEVEGSDADGAAAAADGFGEAAGFEPDESEALENLGIVWSESGGAGGGIDGFGGIGIGVGGDAVEDGLEEVEGEVGEGGGVLGVEFDGAAEHAQGLAHAGGSELVIPDVIGLADEAPGVEILGGDAEGDVGIGADEFAAEGGDDGLGDVFLQDEDVSPVVIVVAGGDDAFLEGIGEFDGDERSL
jgi:hypothetical protein